MSKLIKRCAANEENIDYFIEELAKARANVKPIVLCKDCKYHQTSELCKDYMVCTYLKGVKFVRNDDDFCSRGEKKETDFG